MFKQNYSDCKDVAFCCIHLNDSHILDITGGRHPIQFQADIIAMTISRHTKHITSKTE